MSIMRMLELHPLPKGSAINVLNHDRSSGAVWDKPCCLTFKTVDALDPSNIDYLKSHHLCLRSFEFSHKLYHLSPDHEESVACSRSHSLRILELDGKFHHLLRGLQDLTQKMLVLPGQSSSRSLDLVFSVINHLFSLRECYISSCKETCNALLCLVSQDLYALSPPTHLKELLEKELFPLGLPFGSALL
ncbi:hypothetical protein ACLOJK_036819 [Asimina triloba]